MMMMAVRSRRAGVADVGSTDMGPVHASCSAGCVAFVRFRDGLVGWHIERLARRLEAFEKERA